MNISEPQHKLLKSMSEKVLTHVNYVALELFPIGHFTGEWAARIRKWDESVELAQKELEQLESIGLVAQDSYLGKPWYVLTTAGQEAIRVWGDDLYVHWENEDGGVESAYNLMYEPESGLKTLERILEEQAQVDYSRVGTNSKKGGKP